MANELLKKNKNNKKNSLWQNIKVWGSPHTTAVTGGNRPKMRFFDPYSSARRDRRPSTMGMDRVATPARMVGGEPLVLSGKCCAGILYSKKRGMFPWDTKVDASLVHSGPFRLILAQHEYLDSWVWLCNNTSDLGGHTEPHGGPSTYHS